ncbi:MAG: DNA polymerase III subunit alpha [Tenuifilaceae bacterium]
MIYACHTYYSLKYGTAKVETLLNRAQELGITALVITDINNTTGCFDFVKECVDRGLKPIIGVEFRNDDTWLYTCIAKNGEGFREINEFLSGYNFSKKEFPKRAQEFENVYTIYPLSSINDDLLEYEFIGVRPFELNSIFNKIPSKLKSKLVAFHQVTFCAPHEVVLHKHLRAIDHNTLLSMVTEQQTARSDEVLLAPEKLKSLYSEYPELIKNSERLVDLCSFNFDFKAKKNKQIFSTSRYDDKLLLEKLAYEGMEYRYGIGNKQAEERIRKELDVIHDLGFSSYFLITWDILRHTMSNGIYHIGRGSGGNSIVAYCLKITDIDPIELNLYFERFINPQRTSPPDFDIDFSWKDRDSVYEYIFGKYGKHAALLGTVNTFRDTSIVRELGKVYGMPKNDIDALVEHPNNPLLKNDLTDKIFQVGKHLLDYPHLRSIHAGGILISELPIHYYTALDLPPKGLPTTQFDMYTAEDIGLDKLDILSQRGLGHIKECVEIVKENQGIDIDVHRVNEFKKDPNINQQLYDGEAIGCFYVESPAMRGLLKKLKCNNYISLVAASSIIRPGVAKSGMMKEYINRFHKQSEIKYLAPAFEEHLKETYGVMVYQEDVIKIAHYFAGLSLADADTLRRAMSGKHRSKKEFAKITETFFSNCKARGYSDDLTNEVWRQMSSFAGYAFCKAHSASYAVESYQSLFLKTYFPKEFYTAVINNFGGFYRTWVYVNEARRHGAKINLPDINKSNYLTSIVGDEIYLGWVHVKNLEANIAKAITAERCRNGAFLDLFDFIERVPVGIEQLQLLIKSGAFRFTNKSKKELMWAQLVNVNAEREFATKPMFKEHHREFVLPPLRSDKIEDAYDEMELLGFPVTISRFGMLKTSYRGDTKAKELLSKLGRTVRMVGDLVVIKYVHTVKKEWMHFGCFFDPNGDFFDTVHFPDSLKKYPFTGYGVYLIEGKVVEEFGFPLIEVKKLGRLPFQPDPRVE